MIIGAVNARLEACIPVLAQDAAGQVQALDAVIDTGFSGFLALPAASITALGLVWLCEEQAMLADGSGQVLDVYEGTVIWENQTRAIRVTAADTCALVGMQLLEGHDVRMRIIDGGMVTVEPIP